ncbi:MAG: nucleotidyltransferase domain-containing protein [Chloroflexi bacterium]|nr:nucleotidyltransferase domain-containing protein [Chloroflexota bacterium]
MTRAIPQAAQDNVGAILDQLTAGLRSILRQRLVGVYLYGSLITGDFDPGISDIDLVVVIAEELDEASFKALHQLHQQVVERYPDWDDRLELAYISRLALRAFRRQHSTIGIISPGEPFHLLRAGEDWLSSWFSFGWAAWPWSVQRYNLFFMRFPPPITCKPSTNTFAIIAILSRNRITSLRSRTLC